MLIFLTMDLNFWPFASLLLSILVFFIGFYLAKLKAKQSAASWAEQNRHLAQELKQKKAQLSDLQVKNNDLLVEKTKLESNNQNLLQKISEQKKEFQLLKDENRKDFELLANKILDEKSQKFTQQNKLNLETVLNPLKERIKDFEQKIEFTHKDSLAKNASLRQKIEDLSQLNQQITQETMNLTKALKSDTKMQGAWGELVLAKVLEKSGLEEGREYHTQQHFRNEEGKSQRPDVVVNLPKNKKMIIDSKVSLTAYARMIELEDKNEVEQALKQHLLSINAHIQQLSEKKYEQIYAFQSPDFVLMFIPIETAFATALNADPDLYNRAFEKNIIIVTPTTLLATLRTVDSWWNNEKQQQNALDIAKESGKLYDQFVNLTNDLVKVGKQIQTVQLSYEGSMKKLTGRGNLIGKIEKLKKMGAKASKQINKNLIDRAQDES